MWTCEMCGREFRRKNQSHSCKSVNTIEEYIALFSTKEQEKMKELYEIIKKSAPDAEEKISWNMPTFVQHENIAHFAMLKNHLGFYVGASTVKVFKDKLMDFTFSKGSIHFRKDQPLPNRLIEEIVRFNIKKNESK